MADAGKRRIAFRAPFNRTEILWGKHHQRADFVDLVDPSPGATVRVLVPGEPGAREIYLQTLGPRAQDRSFSVGSATFFDPLIVAIHVKDRSAEPHALIQSTASAGSRRRCQSDSG